MDLNTFKNWALQQGSVAKYNDGAYLGECVSLINQYCYRSLSVAAGAWGHAYAWAHDTNPNRAFFDKVSNIQAGDIVVYPSSFGGGFGHIVIALGNGQMLDQNGIKARTVATGSLWNNYSAILRRKGGVPKGANDMPTPMSEEEVRISYQWVYGREPGADELKNRNREEFYLAATKNWKASSDKWQDRATKAEATGIYKPLDKTVYIKE